MLLASVTFYGVSAKAEAPAHVDPSEYGMDPATGKFIHPDAAPFYSYSGRRPIDGSLDYLEDKQYLHNMSIEGHWPIVVKTGHSWQHIIDMNDRRYMFHYYRTVVKVYDITDPENLNVVLDKKYTGGSWFGAASIEFNEELEKWIMIQAFEVPRSIGGLKEDQPSAGAAPASVSSRK